MVASVKCLLFIAINAFFISLVGGTCTAANVSTYSTSDINLSSLTVFTAEFSIECDQQERTAERFFSQVNGVVLEMAKGTDKYQVLISRDEIPFEVTWTHQHSLAVPGRYKLQVYDEEGFAHFRKAQRSGLDATSVKPIHVIDINHPGARSPKPSVPIEAYFILALIALMWFAFLSKSRLLE